MVVCGWEELSAAYWEAVEGGEEVGEGEGNVSEGEEGGEEGEGEGRWERGVFGEVVWWEEGEGEGGWWWTAA